MTATARTRFECPRCGNKAKTVLPLTVRSLLTEEAAGRITEADYRFCKSKDCDVVQPSTGRGEKIAQLGAVASAIIASSCCWLPLALLAVGVSGAGIASALDAYRPLFTTVTFGFLGAAFYFTYRPRKAPTAAADSCCSPQDTESDSCCSPTGENGRYGVMAMNKAMLWGATVLAAAFLWFPSYAGLLIGGGSADSADAQHNPLVRQTTLAIEGMECEGCAVVVEKSIEDVPGVLDAKVNYQAKQVIVATEACCPFPEQEVRRAMQQAGYPGRRIDAE